MDQVDKDTRLSETAPDPFLGRTVDGYRIDDVVGRGGMGVVYRATQLSLNRPVAIKVLPPDVAEHPQFLERFHREVDVLSKLAHPNIVTVFERGEVDGRQYLVMEYVRGTSLRDVIRKGPLPRAEALAIVRSVLAALEHAHDAGIVHRDIKPENVLVAPGGIVKVADFGLSRLLGPAAVTRLTHTHLLLGTFEYMAPEQREKAKEADERSDLYATGVVLYEMLTGELPIGHFELPSSKRPKECDARIDDVVRRSLEKDPAKRWQRASEMGGEVSRLLSAAALPEEKGEGVRGEGTRRHGHVAPMSEAAMDASIKAAMNPWAAASYVVGVFWLVAMAIFGTDHDERFWMLASAGSTALYFTAVPLLHKKRYLLLSGLVPGIAGVSLGGLALLAGPRQEMPAPPAPYAYRVADYAKPAPSFDSAFNALLNEPDVQIWMKRNVPGVQDMFPEGVRVSCTYDVVVNNVIVRGGGVRVTIDAKRYTETTARNIAVALGRLFAAREPAVLRRLLTGTPLFEDRLDEAGLPWGGGMAPDSGDGDAIAAPAAEESR